jgi:hypothetical protein
MKKPVIKLTPLEKTVIWTPTKKSYIQLMRIFECAGWLLHYTKGLPTEKIENWDYYGKETCVEAGIHFDSKTKKLFGYASESFFDDSHEIIHYGDFYETQRNITQNKLKEINAYFDWEERKERKKMIIKKSSLII